MTTSTTASSGIVVVASGRYRHKSASSNFGFIHNNDDNDNGVPGNIAMAPTRYRGQSGASAVASSNFGFVDNNRAFDNDINDNDDDCDDVITTTITYENSHENIVIDKVRIIEKPPHYDRDPAHGHLYLV